MNKWQADKLADYKGKTCNNNNLTIEQENQAINQGSLTEGEGLHSWPSCANYFWSAPFNIKNIIYIFYKTNCLNDEVNCTEPTPQLVFPVLTIFVMSQNKQQYCEFT